MKILFLSHEDDKVMGSTLSLANMAHALQQKGCETLVALPGEGPAKQYLEKYGIRTITTPFHVDFVGGRTPIQRILSFPYRYIRDRRTNRQAIETICQAIKGETIDIVHTNTAVLDFGPALAHRLHAPHVWHLREFIDLDMGYQPFLGWKHLRRLIHQSSATISITKAIAQHYQIENRNNSYVLFDAVRSKADLMPTQETRPQFVFCGQLAPHKAPDMAIRAFIRIAEQHPDYKLLIMGTGTDDSYVEYLHCLVPNRLIDRVVFMGYVGNPDLIISQSSALLMCSNNEAQGRVTIEAMLQGCLVIGNNAGGTREIIENEKTGWLFDNEEQLTDLLIKRIDCPAEAKEIIDSAKMFAREHFLEESYGERLLQIYQKVCQS